MVNKPLMVRADISRKGLLMFWFKGSTTVFLLASTGKLQVKWSCLEEKKLFFRFLRDVLVPCEDESLVIKPLRQQAWIEYPELKSDKSFELYWCDEATEFVLKPPSEPKPQEQPNKFVIEFENVRKTVWQLRREFAFFREPTFNEVAHKVTCVSAQHLRDYLSGVGWKTESIQDAKAVAEQAINLAGWLSYKEKDEQNPALTALCKKAIDSAHPETLRKAQIILKKYPDLVPCIEPNHLRWPEETKAKWIQVFANEPPVPQTWK